MDENWSTSVYGRIEKSDKSALKSSASSSHSTIILSPALSFSFLLAEQGNHWISKLEMNRWLQKSATWWFPLYTYACLHVFSKHEWKLLQHALTGATEQHASNQANLWNNLGDVVFVDGLEFFVVHSFSVKQAKGEGENAKVSVRRSRKDSNEDIKKLKKQNI